MRMPVDKIKNLFLREFSAVTDRPRRAILELTYRCNLRCKTCSVWKIKHKKEKELTTGEIHLLLNKLQQMNVSSVLLVGAESLIREDITQIIKDIKSRGMSCYVSTNGTLITPLIALNMVSHRLDSLSISIDAPNNSQEEIRSGPGGSFLKVLEGIEEVKRKRIDSNRKLPKINIHTTISSLNIGMLEEMSLLAQKLGVDSLSYYYLSETKSEAVRQTLLGEIPIASDRFIPRSESFLFKMDQLSLFRKELNNIRNVRKKNGLIINLRVLNLLSDSHLLEGKFPIKTCYFIHDTIIINPYGHVYPCAHLDKYVLGNIREESIQKIWRNDKRELLKKSLKRKMFPVCSSCCHFHWNLIFSQQVKAKLMDFDLKFFNSQQGKKRRIEV